MVTYSYSIYCIIIPPDLPFVDANQMLYLCLRKSLDRRYVYAKDQELIHNVDGLRATARNLDANSRPCTPRVVSYYGLSSSIF